MLPGAYRGRILVVDLSNSETRFIATADYADTYLGGRGIATGLYYDLVPPEASSTDPENCLIAMTGPLAGVPAIGGSRWGLYAKSPASFRREHFCHGNLGGSFGAELKFAGLDGLVITGIAPELSVLHIEGGGDDITIKVREARDWKGLGAETTLRVMKEHFGKNVRTMTIGPAGEALIPFASVLAEGGASCSGGMGAVMGSRNLKAVVVRGTDRTIPVEDRETLRKIEKEIRAWDRGNVKVWGLDFMAQGPQTGKLPCYGCMANCLRVKYTAADGTVGKFMCQSRFFYMALSWAYYGGENDAAFQANRLCDELGLDTWAVQDLVDWLVRCRDSGVLDDRRTGLPLAGIGSIEFIEQLLGIIVSGEGFGSLMAGGAEDAARKLGGSAEQEFRHHDPYEPRYCPLNTFLIPFETRIPIQQLHEAGLTLAKWSTWAKGTEGAHLSTDLVREIARRFWGSEDAADFSGLAGAPEAARRIQDRQLAKECLCVCDWMYPVLDIPVPGEDGTGETTGVVGNPELEAAVLRAVIGGDWSPESLALVGERVFQLQRAILLREGHHPPTEDVLPREWHEDPLDGHVADPDCLVPGPGGKTISRLGETISMEEYLPARDEFYRLRGWDCRTGLPSRIHLEELGLVSLAEDLERSGLLVAQPKGPSTAARVTRWLQKIRRRGKGPLKSECREMGPSLEDGEILAILDREKAKYADPRIVHNFAGWNKEMQYRFPDIDGWFVIPISAGLPGQPGKLEAPLPDPAIQYEMHSSILKAMDDGRINGMQAYQKRLLKTKAAFGDLMKLQALNKVS